MSASSPRRRRWGLCFAVVAAIVIGLGLLRASRERQDRQRGGASLTVSKAPDRHQLAVAILAIATAAIGFGIFEGDLEVGSWAVAEGFAKGAQLGKLLGISSAGVFYFLVLLSTGRAFQYEQISGRQLVVGPLQWLYLEMVSLAGLYFINLVEELAGD